jgi:hypothetical protein
VVLLACGWLGLGWLAVLRRCRLTHPTSIARSSMLSMSFSRREYPFVFLIFSLSLDSLIFSMGDATVAFGVDFVDVFI